MGEYQADEDREVAGGKSPGSKDLGFYSKWDEKPLKGFKQMCSLI